MPSSSAQLPESLARGKIVVANQRVRRGWQPFAHLHDQGCDGGSVWVDNYEVRAAFVLRDPVMDLKGVRESAGEKTR